MRMGDFEVVETASGCCKVGMPYIPGLLSFREAPACIAAVEKLEDEPDVFIIDGQGIAHPRRLGLAAHLGLFFDRPRTSGGRVPLHPDSDSAAAPPKADFKKSRLLQ
jgi:deoxyribonuclease V